MSGNGRGGRRNEWEGEGRAQVLIRSPTPSCAPSPPYAVSPDAIAAVSKHCAEHDKIYCMNLSAPFIMQVPPFKKVGLA